MGFFSNLVSAPFKGIGDIVKGVGQTIISPFKAAWDGLKTVGTVAKDFLTLNWTSIPGDAIKGTLGMVGDLAEGPLNVARGTVGLGALVGGTVAGSAFGPIGGAAGYATAAQFANWIE